MIRGCRSWPTTNWTCPKNPADRLAVADAWWTYAETQPQALRSGVRLHAGMWYAQASAGLTGLSKLKAEQRATEYLKSVAPSTAVADSGKDPWRCNSAQLRWPARHPAITAAQLVSSNNCRVGPAAPRGGERRLEPNRGRANGHIRYQSRRNVSPHANTPVFHEQRNDLSRAVHGGRADFV